ncbi:MAG: carbon-nitrogen hydrolase family protein [Syntrophorhabdales bacterium]|jgi:aliphatic nitrilase
MGDVLPKFKAAAVQAAAVFLDREASVEKACSLIRTAAENGAELIALPEVFIPGGPYWAWHMSIGKGCSFFSELFLNSVDLPSKATVQIGEVAKKYGVYVVIGINERDHKTIYNTLLFYDRKGQIMGKHRKLKPTAAEKLVWGEGDGSTHKVYETDIGRIGGLICGEHTMALPAYTLAAMGEQVHIASWVGFAVADTTLTEVCSRYHAIAYSTFVVCSQSLVDEATVKKLGVDMRVGGAWTSIIEAGSGRIMAGPVPATEEGIVYAEIDLSKAIPDYFVFDVAGQYWPKQFRVLFDARELKPLNVLKADPIEGIETEKAGEEATREPGESKAQKS